MSVVKLPPSASSETSPGTSQTQRCHQKILTVLSKQQVCCSCCGHPEFTQHCVKGRQRSQSPAERLGSVVHDSETHHPLNLRPRAATAFIREQYVWPESTVLSLSRPISSWKS